MNSFNFVYTPRSGSKLVGKMPVYASVPVFQLSNKSYLIPRSEITKLEFWTADPDSYWRDDAREVGSKLTQLGIPVFDDCGRVVVFCPQEDGEKIYDLFEYLNPIGQKSRTGERLVNRVRAGKEVEFARLPFLYNPKNRFLRYWGGFAEAPEGARLIALPHKFPSREEVWEAFKHIRPLPKPDWGNHSEWFKETVESLGNEASIFELENAIPHWEMWEAEIMAMLMLGE